MAYAGQGDNARARFHFENAVKLTRSLGNKRQLMAAINALAQSHRADGKFDEAKPLYEDVLSLARELGDQQSVAIAPVESSHGFYRRRFHGKCPRHVARSANHRDRNRLAACRLRARWRSARGSPRKSGNGTALPVSLAQPSHTSIERACSAIPPTTPFLAPLIASVRTALDHERYTAAEAAGQTLISRRGNVGHARVAAGSRNHNQSVTRCRFVGLRKSASIHPPIESCNCTCRALCAGLRTRTPALRCVRRSQ